MTVDGLGGEEVNQTVNVQTTNVIGTTSVSGLNVFAQGSGTFGRITDENGAVFSSVYGGTTPGSPGTFGVIVQAGRAGPLIATTGSIVFPIAFTNRNYIVSLAAEGPIADGLGSTVPYISSGISHATSGCTINAGSGYVYNWVAVGR